MKYSVSIKVDGRITLEVDADNPHEAAEVAMREFATADLARMDVADFFPVNCEDAEGNLVDLC